MKRGDVGRGGIPLALAAALFAFSAARAPACEHRKQEGKTMYERERLAMVAEQIVARGVQDTAVLAAMRKVPREEFVPELWRSRAYDDGPLPIGKGQTISQPYIVAVMTELARPASQHRVLEIGTGSGYQAAVLAEIVAQVYTIEIVKELADEAAARLKRLGYSNITVRHGDGYRGWPEEAPFDSILITAAVPHPPAPLLEQLKEGGRLVFPQGDPDGYQELVVIEKKNGAFRREVIFPVRFVPMTGEALRK